MKTSYSLTDLDNLQDKTSARQMLGLDANLHKGALISLTARVQSIAEKKISSNLSSSGKIYITASNEGDKGLLEASAFNSEAFIEFSTKAVINNTGRVAVCARLLYDIARKLPHDQVRLQMEKDRLKIISGDSLFSIILSENNIDDIKQSFEEIDYCAELTFKNFSQAFHQTSFAVAQNEARPILCGLSIKADGNISYITATDGHRLAQYSLDCGDFSGTAFDIVVPRKIAGELAKLSKDCDFAIKLYVGKKTAKFICNNTSITTRLIEGKFPDCSKVIVDADYNRSVKINTSILKAAVDRASSIASNDRFHGIKITISNDNLSVYANNRGSGNSNEIIKTENIPFSESIEIGINASYLFDALSTINQESVFLCISSSFQPIRVWGEKDATDNIQIIMPMRV